MRTLITVFFAVFLFQPLAGAEIMPSKTEKATFAAGCFWGVEKIFTDLDGVLSTQVGYTGGTVEDPGYQRVCTGVTGHAEAVDITYDPSKISYDELLEVFFRHHDPTTLDRQGPDIGTQYRSSIFYHNEEQKKAAERAIRLLDAAHIFDSKIVTRLEPAGKFYRAEEYHQKYLKKNPHGYCSLQLQSAKIGEVLQAARKKTDMALNKIEIYNAGTGKVEKVDPVVKTDVEWKKLLTPEQYEVMRRKGTEKPFSNQCAIPASGKGIYRCAACGTALFRYGNKFESGTGWPSFWDPVSPLNMKLHDDSSFGMHRVEVLCARCGSHLGHVFDDGPPPTGKRYCINSVALKLAES